MPSWDEWMAEFEKATGSPERLREEIEQFFVSATFFTGKLGDRDKGVARHRGISSSGPW